MGERVYDFSNWINQRYGLMGNLAVSLAIFAVLALIYYFFRKLSETRKGSKISRCSKCKYEFNKKDSLVIVCTKYKRRLLFQRKKLVCPLLKQENDLVQNEIVETDKSDDE